MRSNFLWLGAMPSRASRYLHRRHPRLLLLQDPDNLLFAEPAALHASDSLRVGLYSFLVTFQGCTSVTAAGCRSLAISQGKKIFCPADGGDVLNEWPIWRGFRKGGFRIEMRGSCRSFRSPILYCCTGRLSLVCEDFFICRKKLTVIDATARCASGVPIDPVIPSHATRGWMLGTSVKST